MDRAAAIPATGADARAWALLLLLGVIWGSSFMLTNIAVREIPPLTLAALRLCFASVLMLAAARLFRGRLPRFRTRAGRRLWRFAFVAAVFGAAGPFWMVSWANLHIPSATTGLLMAPMPLVSLALAHFLLAGQTLSVARVAGFVIGLAGVVLLIGGGDGEAATDAYTHLGRLAALAAMICYALNGIVLKRADAPDALGISAAILTVAALVALPLAIWWERPDFGAISPTTWVIAAALGLGATALGQLLMMWIIDLAGPPFLATVNYQVPLWAAAFGAVFLGEALPGLFWTSLALILAGLAIAQFGGALGRRR